MKFPHAMTKGQLISKCLFEKIVWTKIPTKNLIDFAHYTSQCCVLTNSSPLGVGQAPVENSWGTYKTKNVAQKKLA